MTQLYHNIATSRPWVVDAGRLWASGSGWRPAPTALQKDDDGEGLDLELLTAADRSVMKLSIDGSVFSCSELVHDTTSSADPDSGDSYADPTAASFAALLQCIAMSCPIVSEPISAVGRATL
jgi:hypothetical protein